MEKEQQPIIIKRVKKPGHGGHHGGAWKVAYADFVTAMMAFFLVMWLLAVLSIETKRAIAEYFRSFSIFEGTKSGGTGKGIGMVGGGPIKIDPEQGGLKFFKDFQARIAMEIVGIIETNINKEQREQILVAATSDGIRIEMVEKTGSPLFESGRANLVKVGENIVKAVSESIKNMPNDIIIEGHTDAHQYQMAGYTNWELSADRANAVRRELINDGIDASRIKQVASFADNLPIKRDDPYAPINRRVSILLLSKKKGEFVEEPMPKEPSPIYTLPATNERQIK